MSGTSNCDPTGVSEGELWATACAAPRLSGRIRHVSNRRSILPIIIGWIASLVLMSGSSDAQPALLLTGGRVLDEAGRSLRDGRAVLIVDGRIQSVNLPSAIEAPQNVRRVDLSGLVLTPGLIDLHTHLLLHPYDEAAWDDQVLRESLELRTIRAVMAARATLDAGFTTIRDLGTEGAGFADVAVRDAIAGGLISGPRIYTTTRAIVATGCYAPAGFDPRWNVPQGAQVADGIDGVRRAVRQQIAGGADWIKIYADFRRKPGAATTPCFSQEELSAIGDEARSAGVPVAAHATTDAGARRAILAGVATIEHGYELSETVLELMRERNVVLCPTLSAVEAMARYDGWRPGSPDPDSVVRARELIAEAMKIGVTIACGSDAGVFSHGDNAREIELLIEYGMPADRALRAATIDAAIVLGREHELGRIKAGYVADLIAVRGNPLENPAVLRKPVMVIREGHVVVDRREP